MKIKVLSVLSLAILLALQGAYAQEESESDESEAGQSEETAEAAPDIETIQVTARRREERLLDVPLSVTSVSDEELFDAGAQDITYLKQSVPNTTLEVSRGTNNTLTAFIRGIGQQDPVAGFEAGVGIYIDDVYLNRPQAAVLDIYDLERVEVLRGPQGTLYGRNTIGGAVKYVTRRLGREPSASVRASVGSYSQADLVVSAETPIGNHSAVGGAFATFNRDGFGTNLNLNEDNHDKEVLAGRVRWEWTPTDALFVRLSGDYFEDDSNPVGGHRLIPGLFSGAPVLDNVFDSRSGMQGPHGTEAWGASLLAEYNFNASMQFKSITAWRDDESIQQIDFEALPVVDLDVPVIYENDQFSQEFQLNFTGDRLSGVAGFYYLDATAFNAFDVRLFQTGDLIGLPGLNAFTLGNVETETWSVFADASFDLTTALELSLGGRYTEDERNSNVQRQLMLGESSFFGGDPTVIARTSDFLGSATFTDFSPRVSLAWKPTVNHNAYASYSQGFKGGGFDPRGQTSAAPDLDGDGTVSDEEIFEFMSFDSEEVDALEVGLKSQFANGRVTTNFALFYNDYTNIQVPGSVGVDTTGDGISDTFTGVTTNAGEATVKGAEFELAATLGYDLFTGGDDLRTTIALGYTDAEYDEFITAISDPATGQQALEDVSDERVFQNTPDTTAHWTMRYNVPMNLFSANGIFSIRGSWSYRSETHQFEIPSEFLDQPGYSLFDLSLLWSSRDGRVDLGLHGRNLGDKEYIVSGYNFATPDGQESTLGLEGVLNAFHGAPRTVTLTGTFHF